jgi:hypothetical protein
MLYASELPVRIFGQNPKFGKLGIEIELKMTRIRKASAKKEARNVKNRDKIVK